jgi:hypothetical protein
VFSLYDTLFNVTFVGSAVVTAVLLPDNGHSPTSVVVIAFVYLALAGVYLRMAGRTPPVPGPADGTVPGAAMLTVPTVPTVPAGPAMPAVPTVPAVHTAAIRPGVPLPGESR